MSPAPAVGRAQVAADALRAVADATRVAGDADGYTTPADVAAVLTVMDDAVHTLQAVLTQAAGWLAAEARAGRVGHDTWGPDDGGAAPELTTIAVSLDSAVRYLRWAATEIAQARDRAHRLTRIASMGERS